MSRDLRDQWQESRVLRLGSWLVVLIFLLYLLLWLDERLALEQLEWRRQVQAKTELEALQGQGYWPDLVEKLEQQQQRLVAQAWKSSTPGLAKAAVREFIDQSARVTGLRLRQTQFAEPRLLIPGVWEMRGQLTATAEGSTVPWPWIAALEKHRPALILDHLDIRVGRRSGVSVNLEFRVTLTGLEESGQ